MTYELEIDELPNRQVEVGATLWRGTPYLKVDGERFEPENGVIKIPRENAKPLRIHAEKRWRSLLPKFELDGRNLVAPLELAGYELVWCGLPSILFLWPGGALGGAIGVGTSFLNVHVFRKQDSTVKKFR